MSGRSTLIYCLCISLLGALSWLAYAPGLHGGFLFDDFANLPALGANGPILHWPTFWRYITSGTADPTGRPLTLLTFLLDARNWPADPLPFKRTNLVLHLINGALLAVLLRQLGRETFTEASPRRVDLAALTGAGFWMLHPLFVSTTLYIVQREAILPATFVLLGLLAWLRGRKAVMGGRILPGLGWIGAGLGGCTLLGVLSKANGILLPVLALVLEYVWLRSSAVVPAAPPTPQQENGSTAYRRAMLLFAWLPAVVVAAYLVEQGWSGLTRGISEARPWTLAQRLLTEPRVLVDYLDLLWLPRPYTPGLFNDQIQASTSLWSPATTLPAMLAVASLISAAWLLRNRWPAAALAVLFYFVGQSLESSTIALELYFEHRNYLPALLMFWPLALWLCGVTFQQTKLPSALRASQNGKREPPHPMGQQAISRLKFALAAVIMLGLGVMTHARASLWGNEHDQALLWARLNPESPRAQANAAAVEMSSGQPARAEKRLKGLLRKNPDQVQLALNLFGAQCQLGRVDPSTLSASYIALGSSRDPGTLLVSWFERALLQLAKPPCPQLNATTLSKMLTATLGNPHLASNPGRQQDLHYLFGRLALMQGNANTALDEFNRALDLQVHTSVALKQAALLGASGYPQQGLAHLRHLEGEPPKTVAPGVGMPQIHAWVLRRQDYWPRELARLRATLQSDALRQTRTAQ